MVMIKLLCIFRSFFFFNDTATTEIYTLSLHDALPISRNPPAGFDRARRSSAGITGIDSSAGNRAGGRGRARSFGYSNFQPRSAAAAAEAQDRHSATAGGSAKCACRESAGRATAAADR